VKAMESASKEVRAKRPWPWPTDDLRMEREVQSGSVDRSSRS